MSIFTADINASREMIESARHTNMKGTVTVRKKQWIAGSDDSIRYYPSRVQIPVLAAVLCAVHAVVVSTLFDPTLDGLELPLADDGLHISAGS